MKRIFLDYASTTPLDKQVFKAMLPYMRTYFGNPSAVYKEGVATKNVVKAARQSIATLLAIRPEEIIFTASGTESDNLALRGVVEMWKKEFVPHIVTTTIEHPGILEVCKALEKQGCEVTYVPVEKNGIVDPQKIKAALKSTTVLVTVMYANNEIGTIQPLKEISKLIQEYKKSREGEATVFPYFHTDASQAANYLDLSFQKLGVDMMTLDASKIYGPKGVGVLAAKRHVSLHPIILGGGQEKGLRAGTENVPGIIGCATALVRAEQMREKETLRLKKLQDYFIENVIKLYPDVIINGDRYNRLPNNVNICKPGLDSEFAVIKLDYEGIACSSASSCLNLSEESYSYVVAALGDEGNTCKSSSLRFTFGRKTTLREIKLTLNKIRSILITQ